MTTSPKERRADDDGNSRRRAGGASPGRGTAAKGTPAGAGRSPAGQSSSGPVPVGSRRPGTVVPATRRTPVAWVKESRWPRFPAAMTYEEWVELGGVLSRMERRVQWWVGDWWLVGERRFGEAAAKAAVTSYALKTVQNHAAVAKSFHQLSRRREELSFAHHEVVAGLEPQAADRLLDDAIGHRWNRDELRRRVRRLQHTESLGAAQKKAVSDLASLAKYAVVLADPPWSYDDRPSRGAAEDHYETMDLDAICALAVPAADDAILFLWVPVPLLVSAAPRVFKAWGFEYKTAFVWHKDGPGLGLGRYNRVDHENLLVGRRGALPLPTPDHLSSSVFTAPRGAHSSKPDVAYDIITRAYPGFPKLDLFARASHPGFDSWGDQAP